MFKGESMLNIDTGFNKHSCSFEWRLVRKNKDLWSVDLLRRTRTRGVEEEISRGC